MRALTPAALAHALASLRVEVEGIEVRTGWLRTDDYPGGRRPTGILELRGRGTSGFGENVAFTREEQAAFATAVAPWVPPGTFSVGDLDAGLPPFARAAIEGALIDLGLRQRGLSLAAWTGVPRGNLRWVASFDACADPATRAQALAVSHHATEWKVDVAPTWTDAAIGALRRTGGVVTLDFKGLTDVALCERLVRAFPDAIFEDPPPSCRARRIAFDRPLLRASDVGAAVAQGRLVNLKAPRMGGFLELLRGLEASPRDTVYLGGMFEVGPGREQARQLAAAFCPDAPNDLGPIHGTLSTFAGASPAPVCFDRPGFGAGPDWRRVRLEEL